MKNHSNYIKVKKIVSKVDNYLKNCVFSEIALKIRPKERDNGFSKQLSQRLDH